jgi:ribosomal protein S18 acetylase RimI-like enzyme
MQVLIRRAKSSDAAAVAELYLRARRAGSTAGTIPPLVHSAEETRAWVPQILIGRLECWVAERESGAVAGMLVLDAEWVDHLYVDPALTRRGIGTELIEVAKRERPGGLRLWTFASNLDAQRFYRRHGFTEIERTDGSDNEEGAPDIQFAWNPKGGETAWRR